VRDVMHWGRTGEVGKMEAQTTKRGENRKKEAPLPRNPRGKKGTLPKGKTEKGGGGGGGKETRNPSREGRKEKEKCSLRSSVQCYGGEDRRDKVNGASWKASVLKK